MPIWNCFILFKYKNDNMVEVNEKIPYNGPQPCFGNLSSFFVLVFIKFNYPFLLL